MLLIDVLRNPESMKMLRALDWDLLIRQARASDFLGRVWQAIEVSGLVEYVPDAPKRHLTAAGLIVERQQEAVRREIEFIDEAMRNIRLKAVLLKGAAYVASGKALAVGRTFSDIDVLVNASEVAAVEMGLSIHGWQPTKLSAYDEAYYRRWMHEIPPLVHVKRSTTLDLHHSILPGTARIKVNTLGLFEGNVPVDGCTNLSVLQEADMLLHSATHLFHEGELPHGLRDLHDLHLMFQEFGEEPTFWGQLSERADYLGLVMPLAYAVRYCGLFFNTSFPDAFRKKSSIRHLSGVKLYFTDFCYVRALLPKHESCERLGSEFARMLVYLRSHWLKMPLPLLIYHLSVKSLARIKFKKEDEPAH